MRAPDTITAQATASKFSGSLTTMVLIPALAAQSFALASAISIGAAFSILPVDVRSASMGLRAAPLWPAPCQIPSGKFAISRFDETFLQRLLEALSDVLCVHPDRRQFLPILDGLLL
ncbi:hypothetical protein [Bradyrhizobium sp. WSM1417]